MAAMTFGHQRRHAGDVVGGGGMGRQVQGVLCGGASCFFIVKSVAMSLYCTQRCDIVWPCPCAAHTGLGGRELWQPG